MTSSHSVTKPSGQGSMSLITRALQRLLSTSQSPAPGPRPRRRRRGADVEPALTQADQQTLIPLQHLQHALDSLPHGRSALRQLHAVEVALGRGDKDLAELGHAVLGSALCQLGLLQCRRPNTELELLRMTLEQAARDARAGRPRASASPPVDSA